MLHKAIERESDLKAEKAPWGFALFAGFVGATIITIWRNGGINSHGTADTLMFIGFLIFLGWLTLPRRDKAPGHEGADKGLALRLGKSLKRILRPLKG